MDTIIRFENISKRYNLGLTRTSMPTLISGKLKRWMGKSVGDSLNDKFIWALRDVSFELKQGHSLALIGPNGAGKSTILKLLANITKPTSGRFSVKGRLSALIELGAGFHSDLTGRENIFLNGAILGLKRDEIKRNFDEIVAFSELERFIDTPVKRYSSGMTVRLGFAVAACVTPDILLVDEVLAVGDAAFRHKCLNRIQSLLDSGTSIIFVSHSMSMVKAVCREALYISAGQIVSRGGTTDVINLYEREVHEERARIYEELSGAEQTAGKSATEIRRVEVRSVTRMNTTTDLHADENVEICVHYRAHETIEAVSFTVRIISSTGLLCCVLRTSIDDLSLSLSKGQGVVSVLLEPLQLAGGTYLVEAVVTNESSTLVFGRGSSEWFFVEDPAFFHGDQRGVFEPRRKWEHQSVPNSVLDTGGEETRLTDGVFGS